MTIISSQRYLDEEIVQAKRDDSDYIVTLSPEFEIDGDVVQVVIDGHHSYHAALADGVAPVFVVSTVQDDDRIALLPDVEAYLEVNYVDSDWYDISTGLTYF